MFEEHSARNCAGNEGATDWFRAIPPMDELLNTGWAAEYAAILGRETVKITLQEVLDAARREARDSGQRDAPADELVRTRAQALLESRASSTLAPIVNATGVVIHTNLGRAPLADSARVAVDRIAGTYSTLEYSRMSGGRGSRADHVEWLIRLLTGAEAALVVNNNAAAVLLTLSGIAAGRQVIVSSGELVEIGGSFRIPEILSFSGAKMIAIGCTNATRIDDYRAAVTGETAALLKVHPSNYRIEGFVTSTSRAELAALAFERGIAFIEDLGSGLLSPLAIPFAKRERSVRECLAEGAHIVTFSGDKLLGGPQIGVIAGSKQLVDRLRCHQLLRALRVDKMTLAAFEATLRLYLSGRPSEIPVIRMIEVDADALFKRARSLYRLLKEALPQACADDITLAVVETSDAIGGGAFPASALPGWGISLCSASRSAHALAAALRAAPVPIASVIRDDAVILHVRTLLPGDDRRIAGALKELACRQEEKYLC